VRRRVLVWPACRLHCSLGNRGRCPRFGQHASIRDVRALAITTSGAMRHAATNTTAGAFLPGVRTTPGSFCFSACFRSDRDPDRH
jgi:hypothetical protein